MTVMMIRLSGDADFPFRVSAATSRLNGELEGSVWVTPREIKSPLLSPQAGGERGLGVEVNTIA